MTRFVLPDDDHDELMYTTLYEIVAQKNIHSILIIVACYERISGSHTQSYIYILSIFNPKNI